MHIAGPAAPKISEQMTFTAYSAVGGGASTSISVSALVNQFVTFLLDCMFGKMILPRLKSSIPAGFCELNHRWSLVQGKLCIFG